MTTRSASIIALLLALGACGGTTVTAISAGEVTLNAVPAPRIFGAGSNEEITTLRGYKPFRVQVRAVYSMHDVGGFDVCRAIERTLPKAPKSTPEGQQMETCLRGVMEKVETANRALLGDERGVTRARFEWDFGLPAKTSRVLDSTLTYSLEQQEGMAAGYVYDKPGTFQLNLRVTNSRGVSAVARTVTVEVLERPPTAPTIYVSSSSGADANSGLTQNKAVRSLRRAQELLDRLAAPGAQVLFKRGDEFAVTETFFIRHPDVRVADYGTAEARPILRWTRPNATASIFWVALGRLPDGSWRTANAVVENLVLDTDLKGIFGTSAYYEKTGVPDGISVATRGVLVRNVTFLDISSAVFNNAKSWDVLVVGSSAPAPHGIRAYFVWNEGINVHVMGSRIANSTREHGIRSTGGHLFTTVYGSDLENQDNRGLSDPDDFSKTAVNNQFGFHFTVRNSRVFTSSLDFGPLGGGDGRGGQFVAYGVVEGNHLINSRISGGPGAIEVAVRNNVVENGYYDGISVQSFDHRYQRGLSRIFIANNTVVAGPATAFCFGIGSAKKIELVNNLCLDDGAPESAKMIAVDPVTLTDFVDLGGNVSALPLPANWYESKSRFDFSAPDRLVASSELAFVSGDLSLPMPRPALRAANRAEGVFADRQGNERDEAPDWVGALVPTR